MCPKCLKCLNIIQLKISKVALSITANLIKEKNKQDPEPHRAFNARF